MLKPNQSNASAELSDDPKQHVTIRLTFIDSAFWITIASRGAPLRHRRNVVRWIHMEPCATNENRDRDAIRARIDAWWRVFADRIDDIEALLRGERDWNVAQWMNEQLGAVDQRLMWEFVSDPAGRPILTLTPESETHLRPMVAELLRRAPQMNGWSLASYRPHGDVEVARMKIGAFDNAPIDDWKVIVRLGDENRVDLVYRVPGLIAASHQSAAHSAFRATEVLAGEEWLDRWIGVIEVEPDVGESPDAIGLESLHNALGAAIDRIQAGLPSSPCYVWTKQCDWSILKSPGRRLVDCARQEDIYVARTPDLNIWRATRHDSFYNERFSRCGETFCYLKLDGSEGLDEEHFADKSEIEDAVDEVLVSDGLGCQIGGGTGSRYSYVELALMDVHSAVDAIRRRLRDGNISRRSWILFHNADMRSEWIGTYPDSPAPLMDHEASRE